MSEDWKNRLSFIDGIMPEQEDPIIPITTERSTRIKKPSKSKTPDTENTFASITEDVVTELIEQNPVFMATRYYQQARKRMENNQPDAETIIVVANLLQSAINYFRAASRAKDVRGCNLYLTNWYWEHGNDRQKTQAIAYARRNIKQTKRTRLTDIQVIEQFNAEAKGKLT